MAEERRCLEVGIAGPRRVVADRIGDPADRLSREIAPGARAAADRSAARASAWRPSPPCSRHSASPASGRRISGRCCRPPGRSGNRFPASGRPASKPPRTRFVSGEESFSSPPVATERSGSRLAQPTPPSAPAADRQNSTNHGRVSSARKKMVRTARTVLSVRPGETVRHHAKSSSASGAFRLTGRASTRPTNSSWRAAGMPVPGLRADSAAAPRVSPAARSRAATRAFHEDPAQRLGRLGDGGLVDGIGAHRPRRSARRGPARQAPRSSATPPRPARTRRATASGGPRLPGRRDRRRRRRGRSSPNGPTAPTATPWRSRKAASRLRPTCSGVVG